MNFFKVNERPERLERVGVGYQENGGSSPFLLALFLFFLFTFLSSCFFLLGSKGWRFNHPSILLATALDTISIGKSYLYKHTRISKLKQR